MGVMGKGPESGSKSGSGSSGPRKGPPKLRRVRLIPAAHSSLFPDDRPLTAYLKPTDDPHIWKIVATKKREAEALPGRSTTSRQTGDSPGSSFADSTAGESSTQKASPAGELADSVLMSIIEATDLLLDEAPMQLKEEVFRTSHHALRLLLKVKQARSAAEQKSALDLLKQVLEDLHRLRGIADEEERFLKDGETLDL